jgi:hypothetical protein
MRLMRRRIAALIFGLLTVCVGSSAAREWCNPLQIVADDRTVDSRPLWNGIVFLENDSSSAATMTFADGRTCTARGRVKDDEVHPSCSIDNVKYGTYDVTVALGGQTAHRKLVVRTRFMTFGDCRVDEKASVECDAD